MNLSESLVEALNAGVVVASVGPVCSTALSAAGINPQVVPATPKMGPLVAALAEHFSRISNKRSEPTPTPPVG